MHHPRRQRALLAALDLEWSEVVLHDAELPAAGGRVSTSSYHQMAQPVYAEAVARWQPYANQLHPVLAVHEPVTRRLGYDRPLAPPRS